MRGLFNQTRTIGFNWYEKFTVNLSISLSHIQGSPLTKKRITAFWKLDPAIITFPPRTKDSQAILSTSYTMSSATKSSKYASRFNIGDLQDIVSPQSIKREMVASQSNPEVKGMSTRGKGTKMKKPTESSEGLPLMERQFHDYVSEKFAKVQILLYQRLAEAREKIPTFQKIAFAKDKKISSLEKDNNTLQKELLLADITANRERMEVMDGAKLYVVVAMLKIKLQMAKEAVDPSFDRSKWDVEAWTNRLTELGDDEEPEEVLALEAGGSGDKDLQDAVAEGSGKGGEEKVDEAAKVLAAQMGDDGKF
ncbi:hypothetical protein Hanom_Chr00s000005g01611881 [Helianthus anomalus]